MSLVRVALAAVVLAGAGACGGPRYERGGADVPPPASAGPAGGSAGPAAPALAGDPGIVARALVNEARAAGAGFFMARIDLADVREGSRFVGWRVRPRAGGEALFGPGRLRPDDVVTRVNGLPLGKPDEFMFAWEVATTAPVIKIELIRAGTPLTLSFEVR